MKGSKYTGDFEWLDTDRVNERLPLCPHCLFLYKTFLNSKESNEREYWLMTEVFVYLHGGKDFCDFAVKK